MCGGDVCEVMWDVNRNRKTEERCEVLTEGFMLEVETHQGPTLSPFLFTVGIDRLINGVMLEITDDICCEVQLEENLEKLEKIRILK